MRCPKCNHEWQFSGPRPKVSDAAFRAAYKKAKGSVYRAAVLLGMHKETARLRGRKLGLKAMGHINGKYKHYAFTDAQILKAWMDGKGAKKGSLLLGMPTPAFYRRLLNIKEYRENPRRFVGQSQRKHMLTTIIAAIAKSNGNYSEAALRLGISRERIRQLVERNVIDGIKSEDEVVK